MFVEFWRFYDRVNLVQPHATYLIEDFDTATKLASRLAHKYTNTVDFYPSGAIYLRFIVPK